jgi:hypothetical protein
MESQAYQTVNKLVCTEHQQDSCHSAQDNTYRGWEISVILRKKIRTEDGRRVREYRRILQRDDGGSLEEIEAALQPALDAIDAGQHKLGGDPETDFLMRYSAAWVYTTMATVAVSILEREKRFGEACELLRKLLGE